jgi:hypothetical protein
MAVKLSALLAGRQDNGFVNYNHKISCKILGFHGGDYEDWCLLGCYALWLL